MAGRVIIVCFHCGYQEEWDCQEYEARFDCYCEVCGNEVDTYPSPKEATENADPVLR